MIERVKPVERGRPVMRLDEALLRVMAENGDDTVDIGDYGVLDEAYALAYAGRGGQRTRYPHPANRHQAVMDAVRRSGKFELIGRIRHSYGWGLRQAERSHPLYRIKAEPPQ